MKLKNILLVPGLVATSLCFQTILLAQTEPPATAASPAMTSESSAPKFGADNEDPKPGEKKGGRSPEERIERLKNALGLTSEQETKLREIFRTEGEKMRAEHKAEKTAPITAEEQKKKMEATRDRLNGLINAMLTPEQQTKYEALRAKNKLKASKGADAAPKP